MWTFSAISCEYAEKGSRSFIIGEISKINLFSHLLDMALHRMNLDDDNVHCLTSLSLSRLSHMESKYLLLLLCIVCE